MDKRSKAGYILTLEEAIKFWQRRAEVEKAMGTPLTREESEHLLQAMQLGKELTVEELVELMKGKKTLIVKNKSDENLHN